MSLQLGTTTSVVISSPDMAREVLQRNDANFSGRTVPDGFRGFHHHEASVIWLPAGELWTSLRRACNLHLFNQQRLSESQHLRRQRIRELISYVSEQSAKGLPADIKGAAFDFMFSLLSCSLLSVDIATAGSKHFSGPQLKDALKNLVVGAASPNVSDFFPFLAAFDIQGKRRSAEVHASKIFAMVDEHIDQRLGAAKEKSDFLGALLHSSDDSAIDRQAVKSLIADLFLAGTDASASTVEWVMTELIRNPEAMAKARAELEAVVGKGSEVEEADIARLPYLQAVVKETLRLHPSVPFLIPHRAEKAAELGGYFIPQGTRVVINMWAIGRDEAVWPDADRFVPERFLDVDVGLRGQDFELIPFGSGRRICPGLPLAFLTVHSMVAALIRGFEWRLPEGKKVSDMDMTERFGITMPKAEPLRAVPVPIAV